MLYIVKFKDNHHQLPNLKYTKSTWKEKKTKTTNQIGTIIIDTRNRY